MKQIQGLGLEKLIAKEVYKIKTSCFYIRYIQKSYNLSFI